MMSTIEASIPTFAIAIFDIDGVVRDVSQSYRRAIADTVEAFTQNQYRPSMIDLDRLKAEGVWNNDWLASQELIYRYFESQGRSRDRIPLDYDQVVNFFQSRYCGANWQEVEGHDRWTGYICQEPLLMRKSYLGKLQNRGVVWGFFSGAPVEEALYALEGRLGLVNPPLVGMGQAPDKPDPTGLFQVIAELEQREHLPPNLPVVYAGDTVADLYTVQRAKEQQPDRNWIPVGVLPPHAQETLQGQADYTRVLQNAGAAVVVSHIETLTIELIQRYCQK
jgi:HAD superfamily phosphatase